MTHNQIDYQSLQETKRHNLEMESQGAQGLAETARHNQAYEQETNRSNLVNESIRSQSQAETERSNRAQEWLKHESNILNYSANIAGVQESSRHNQATEMETNRSNLMKERIDSTHYSNVEKETNRHNVETENAQAFANITGYETSKKSANANLINAEVNRWKAPFTAARDAGSALNSLSNASLNQVRTIKEAVSVGADLIRASKIGGKLK